ncbi:hypothetical protein DWW10_20570 [Bacteroides intestinalis]|uniref:Uncharacterized protein n=1 Tax=Bacteroides intestinalis TaxID=329854 RepID=A0A412XVR8_9BACE|nr:hypothetical protein DWW10_20570 [Bacteroides intestinalis]RHA63563.1 hypothetical protein DW932_02350 [Bacteroides intestinalis]
MFHTLKQTVSLRETSSFTPRNKQFQVMKHFVSAGETDSCPRQSEIISQSNTQYLFELYFWTSFNALISKGFHIIIIL